MDYNLTAAIRADGSLWMWGINGNGQIGNGTTEHILAPIKVMDDITYVSLCWDRTMAIQSDGSLWVWGENGMGQLGTGKTTTVNGTTIFDDGLVPEKILDNVSSISTSHYRTAAVLSDGSLFIWGGIGFDSPHTPVKVFDGVKYAVLTDYTTAAVKRDDSLWMWGGDMYGLLGGNSHSNPVKMLDNIYYVHLEEDYIAVITDDCKLWMWGYDEDGILGNGGGNTVDSFGNSIQTIPALIMDQVSNIQIESASIFLFRALALKNDGSLWAWGESIGYGYDKFTPSKVLDDVLTSCVCTLSPLNTAVIRSDGSLWICGDNSDGQIGDGTTQNAVELKRILS